MAFTVSRGGEVGSTLDVVELGGGVGCVGDAEQSLGVVGGADAPGVVVGDQREGLEGVGRGYRGNFIEVDVLQDTPLPAVEKFPEEGQLPSVADWTMLLLKRPVPPGLPP